MNYSYNKNNSPQNQVGVVRTYIRHGWIPTEVQVQDRENRSPEVMRQPVYNRPRSRNFTRKWSWVSWPWK